jgi:hypothetical protein
MYLVAASGWYAWDAREMNILVGGARWREQWRYPKRFIGGWSAIVTFVGVTIVWLEWPVDPMTRASWPVAATVVISLWALINARRGNGAYRSLEHRLQQLSEPPATVGV